MRDWYIKYNCSHAHCPDDCENPQPWIAKDGEAYCGRCAYAFNEMQKMIPCVELTCK